MLKPIPSDTFNTVLFFQKIPRFLKLDNLFCLELEAIFGYVLALRLKTLNPDSRTSKSESIQDHHILIPLSTFPE